MIGATEIILICAVIFLIFGGKKLPELMKGMGKGVKSFKQGLSEPTDEEMNLLVDEEVKRRADAKLESQSKQSQDSTSEISE